MEDDINFLKWKTTSILLNTEDNLISLLIEDNLIYFIKWMVTSTSQHCCEWKTISNIKNNFKKQHSTVTSANLTSTSTNQPYLAVT
jgi:hypothetical protein